jgi:hypothetical protein
MQSVQAPNEFRKAIRHLRSGVPSPSAARMVTVATNGVEDELGRHETAWRGGAATEPNMIFISADWGFGKTHLRMLLVDSFLRRGTPFIHDHIDGKAGSLAHLHRTVPRWMESLQVGPYFGIRSVIEDALSDLPKIRQWCWKRKTSFAQDLNRAVDGREWAWNAVAGHQYQFPDYSYYHLKALEILTDTAALMAGFSKGGIVLLLDEAENISRQHDVRGRRKTYDTLGRLARERHLFSIVFVTDRFFAQVQDDMQRGLREGWALWPEDARRFLAAVPSVPVAKPPRLNEVLAKVLVSKIAQVYSKGFDFHVPAGFEEVVLAAWNKTATRSVRLLVRIAIDALDRAAQ